MATNVMTLYSTSVGKKVVMAATGVMFFGFLVIHMLGNLQIFLGAEKLDAYAAFLHSNPGLVWAMRLLLIGAVGLHVLAATQLTLQSWRARPRKYVRQRFQETDYAARTMRWSGPLLGLFILYHLLHFTVGTVHPTFVAGEVYANVVAGFSSPAIAGVYIVAMVLLGLHMYHGLWSLFQTLGANHPRYNHLRRGFAVVATLVVACGNISMPVAVLVGLIK